MNEINDLVAVDANRQGYNVETHHVYQMIPISSVNTMINYADFAKMQYALISGINYKTVLVTELDEVYGLNSPLSILVSSEEDQVIGDIPSLELYAFGESIQEVVDELKQDVIDLYEKLEATANETLGRQPKSWKHKLQSLIFKR